MEYYREDPLHLPREADGTPLPRNRVHRVASGTSGVSEPHIISQPVQDLTDSTRSLQDFAHAASYELQEPLRLVASYVGQLRRKFNSTLGSEGSRLLACIIDRVAQAQDAVASFSTAMQELSQHQIEPALQATRAEFYIARDIQQRLFPDTPPALAGFDIAGRSYPTDGTGGDYFDFIPMIDRGLGVVVGDVSGHGLGPALLMVEIRAILRSLALKLNNVSEILTHANQLLAEDTDKHFATLFLARLDPDRQSLTYASAGHRGYVIRWRGNVETLDSTGVALGVMENVRIPESSRIQLEPDDILLLLTDGIEEAVSPGGEPFGVRRMLDLVRFLRKDSAQSIVDTLYKAVVRFTGKSKQQDDITAVVVKAVDY